MRIFMSHHASAKPFVREVREYLPRHVDAWIDEHELLVGTNLTASIREAIQSQTDFLIRFLDGRAAHSEWVKTELQWALEEERRICRPFILPIIIDEPDKDFAWVRDRLYLMCHGYNESDVRHLAAELSSALFAWLSRDLEALRSEPRSTSERLPAADRADALLERIAITIRRIVFPYRRDRPLALRDLLARLHAEADIGIASMNQLHELLFRLRERKMISGIALTG